MRGFAVFGAGHIRTPHAGILAANPRANLVRICDVIESAAGKLAGKHGAQAAARDPSRDNSIARQAESRVRPLDGFIDAVEAGAEPSVTVEDGRRALILPPRPILERPRPFVDPRRAVMV